MGLSLTLRGLLERLPRHAFKEWSGYEWIELRDAFELFSAAAQAPEVDGSSEFQLCLIEGPQAGGPLDGTVWVHGHRGVPTSASVMQAMVTERVLVQALNRRWTFLLEICNGYKELVPYRVQKGLLNPVPGLEWRSIGAQRFWIGRYRRMFLAPNNVERFAEKLQSWKPLPLPWEEEAE